MLCCIGLYCVACCSAVVHGVVWCHTVFCLFVLHWGLGVVSVSVCNLIGLCIDVGV